MKYGVTEFGNKSSGSRNLQFGNECTLIDYTAEERQRVKIEILPE